MSKEVVVRGDVRFGAPCIVGTRISVADILGYISAGDSVEDIVKTFPELTKEKVVAALKYAASILNVTASIDEGHEAHSAR